MSHKPLVSILIPSYNHGAFLPAALESALGQSYSPIEIIVVDDGSSDGSLSIAEAYAARYPSVIRVFTHPGRDNKGSSATINHAFENSRGEYISPFASDDVLYPDKLERQVTFLQNNPEVSLAYGYVDIIDDRGVKCGEILSDDFSHAPDLVERLIVGNRFPGCSIMIRRGCLEKVGLWDESLIYSDWELWIRIASQSRVGFLGYPLAMYRMHGYNTVAAPAQVHLTRILAVMNALLQKASEVGGALNKPRVQALINLEMTYLHYCAVNLVGANRSLLSAFKIDPSLCLDVNYFVNWLSGKEPHFVLWTFRRLPAIIGHSIEWFTNLDLLYLALKVRLPQPLKNKLRQLKKKGIIPSVGKTGFLILY